MKISKILGLTGIAVFGTALVVEVIRAVKEVRKDRTLHKVVYNYQFDHKKES